MGRRRGVLAFVLVGALAAAIGIATYAADAFRTLELNSVDTRFSVRGTEEPPSEVAVVAIDDVTFSRLGVQWPFPRSLHGELIDRLTEAGVRAIAYDVQFTEPTTPREDNALIRAVDRARNVVLATEEVEGRGRTNVFGGDAVLRSIGARAGNSLVPADDDGAYRRFPYSLQGLEGLAVATAEEATGEVVERDGFDSDGAWIDYAGPPETIPTYSFSEVLRGGIDREELSDKIVVVGASAPSLQDVKPTSVRGGLMAGAELQANAIATTLDDLPLRSAPGWADVLLILLFAAVGPLAGYALRPVVAFGVALAGGALFLVVSQISFNSGLILPVVYPLVALSAGAVGTLALHYLRAAFERQRVRFTFSRFVPEEVVDEVLAEGEGRLQLGGVRREATVLFCDLRGFTSYSETRAPEEVVEVLNHYLSEMTDAIMDHGGTLVSYMGDGILAVFGAPIEQPDHADRAIAAAREMLDVRLPAFCEWMRSTGHGDGFGMGVGLNSGEIMSGQVGSERRMEYTTIGDTTNTASRLEGMTKGSGYRIFIADSTRAARNEPDHDLVYVGEREVRGRERPLKVWSLPGEDHSEAER
ncbi:MAG TPA: adenylate/guanylate cyclase domain-containing protein [Solirubrobacterales bacterium]